MYIIYVEFFVIFKIFWKIMCLWFPFVFLLLLLLHLSVIF